MTEPVGLPAYQEVASDLRRRIAAGEFPVGSAIPSAAKLTKTYGRSTTVVRAAIAQLRGDGLVIGQPGKGVFVRSTPEAAAQRAATIEDLARQVDQLRGEIRRDDTARRDDVAADVAALRRHVRLIHAHLIDLYTQLGRPVPEGLSAPLDLDRAADVRSGEWPTASP